MPIVANGVTVTAVYINGVLIDDALANAVDVYGTVVPTDDPSISLNRAFKFKLDIVFTNNDASAATIYADIDQATPTTDRGSIASGQSTTVTFTGLTSGTQYTFYAYAQASGEDASNIVSQAYTTT